MSLEYGIRQPLRFYEKLEHQNRFRKGGNAKVFKHIAPTNYILPFQIKRTAGLFPITGLKYIFVKDGSEIDLFTALGSNQLEKYAFADYDYLVHFGDEPHAAIIPEGEYYLEVTDSVNTWYSEVLELRSFDPNDLSLSDCVPTKIVYWDTCDVADIFYRTVEYGSVIGAKQYKNIIYLDIDVGKPEYEYSEEGEEDGLGNFNPDYKKLEKQYILQGVYPEYFVDALALIPLHIGGSGVVEILTSRGYTGVVDRFTVTPEWQGDLGVWALTDLIFSTEFIVKTNCCGSLDVPMTRCLRGGHEFVATILEGSPNYINFEYTDASDGVTKIPLQDTDKVLIHLTTGIRVMRQYNEPNGTYDPVPLIVLNGQSAIDLNQLNSNSGNAYYFKNSLGYSINPVIDSHGVDAITGEYRIEGVSHNAAIVQVIAQTNNSNNQLVATLSGEQYVSNGVSFDLPAGVQSLFIRALGLNCILGDSNSINFNGINSMSIEGDFIIA